MKSFFEILVSLTFIIFLGACSLGVREAYAPTDPPSIEKGLFTTAQIEGTYSAGTTLMFLWPEKIWNEQTETYDPMTFSQKAESRKNIVRFDEEKAVYEAMYLEAAKELEAKYTKKTVDLEGKYREMLCYSMCDTDDFFCEPDNPDVLFQDTWKPTEDPEELMLIAACQENEGTRKAIESEKDTEEKQKVTPLREKAGAAAQNLLNAVGDRNFFNNLSTFEVGYYLCEKESGGLCTDKKGGTEILLIRVSFSGGYFTTDVGDPNAFGKVTNVVLDEENGFLTFSIPAIDFDANNERYGEIHFDLELNPKGTRMTVQGDIKLDDAMTGKTRIGRFSSSGDIQ